MIDEPGAADADTGPAVCSVRGGRDRGSYFGGDAQSWLNLQSSFDLRRAELKSRTAIEREVIPREAA